MAEGVVDSGARGGSVMAGHTTMRKYRIRYVAGYWIARVPYGSWRRFDTWTMAAIYLRERHVERVAKEAERARRRERDSHEHA